MKEGSMVQADASFQVVTASFSGELSWIFLMELTGGALDSRMNWRIGAVVGVCKYNGLRTELSMIVSMGKSAI
ncbi:MAG: hypothetical protein ABW007_20625 [Chitinophagaceae bacterium]